MGPGKCSAITDVQQKPPKKISGCETFVKKKPSYKQFYLHTDKSFN